MARIRSVHPGMASDEAFMSMSMPAKAGWPLLWTECDDAGVFEWKPIVLKARIFPADNVDFAALLDEYESLGCIKRSESDGKPYGVIRNFCRYQRPKNPSYRFPEELRDPDFTGFKEATAPKPAPALPQEGVSPPENPPQMKEEGGTSEIEDKPLSPSRERRAKLKLAAEQAFGEWYDAFPKHVDPQDAKRIFVRLVATEEVTLEELFSGARGYADDMRAAGTQKHFIKAPAVWLNKGCWANERIPPPRSQPNITPFRGGHDANRSATAEARRQLADELDNEARWGGDMLQIGGPESSHDPDGMLPQGRSGGPGNLHLISR